MSPLLLDQAQKERRQRGDQLVAIGIDALVDDLCDAVELDVSVPNYQLVGPASRKKLKGLIDHYRKFAHPFTKCVEDNTKRFGDRAKKVCAVLTDLEKNTTHWRKGGKKGIKASEHFEAPSCPVEGMDSELFDLLDAIASIDYFEILEDRSFSEQEGLAVVSSKQRAKMAPAAFALPKKRKYLIHDRQHAGVALGRAKGKPEEAAVKLAICKRYPDMPACQEKKGGS